MRSHPASTLLSSIFFVACASSAPPEPRAPAADQPPTPIDVTAPADALSTLRLPETVTPQSYDLVLRIDPAAPTFSGTATIQVELTAPTRILRLHADGLRLDQARALVQGQEVALTVEVLGSNLALTAASPLPAGPMALVMSWQGDLPEAPVGIYRVNDGGAWYVYTQFEPLEARRAFPCFDEPRFKTPYSLTIETPPGLRAVSNMPEREAGSSDDGWARYQFAATPPLPSYLVAFAVGDFDIVAGPKVSDGKVALRVIAPKGKGRLAGFVLDKTPRYLTMLERWFGSPYPYAKLDLVAVPSFSSSGMENAGLITFRETLVLMDGDRAPVEDRLWCEAVLAHELAHMWFGDLVTMAWWDDLWLNEAFATWMSRKAVTHISPELMIDAGALRSTFNVMHGDAKKNARAVRQHIDDEGDVYNAFDGITYAKGAAVLAMIERWIGPGPFQAGVRSYLAAHAHGSATTAELMAHLGRASGRDVAAVVASFVDQPGVPLVELDWSCEPDGGVVLDVAQRAYRLLGDARQDGAELWKIPVCALLSNGKQDHQHCEVLAEARATWRVAAGFCPTFAHPNVGEAGYYHWASERLGPVSLARPGTATFAGYVANLRSGIDSGRTPLARLLEGVEPLFDASLWPLDLDDLVRVLGLVARLEPAALDDQRFHKKVRALLDRVPLDLELGDTPFERRRQPTLVRARAGLGLDAQVLAHAARVADSFLKELEGKRRGKVPAEDVALYLPLHAYGVAYDRRQQALRPEGAGAEDKLWHRLRAAFERARDPNERDVIIEALASFASPELVLKSYSLLLDGTLRAQDLRTLRGRTSGRPEVVEALWGWLTTHFDALVEKLGAKAAPGLPGFGLGFCDEDQAQLVEAFFTAKRAGLPSGIERPLAQTLEGIRLCALTRARYAAEARDWYAGH